MHGLYRKLRALFLLPRFYVLRYFFGFEVDRTAIVSLSAILDRSNPRGVKIGSYSIVTARCIVLSHDFVRGVRVSTEIGRDCFIGVGSIVMPGVRIGDGSVIGAGSVVTKDIPPGTLAVGNPARVVRSIEVGRYGKFLRREVV